MTMRRAHRTLLLVGVALFALAVGSIAATAGNTTALDEDTALTQSSTLDEFNETGVAMASETVPDLTITIAESSEDIGVHGLRYSDFDTTYLRVEYAESIERTVRFYVPRAYWHPHPDTLEAVDGETQITLSPTADGKHTSVEIHFNGETDAVFEVKKQASIVFNARDYGQDWLEDETGVDLPDTSGASEQWEYVPTSELTEDNPTFAIDRDGGDLTLQYDASDTPDPADQKWRTVPKCSSSAGDDAPVCIFEQADKPGRVYVLAQVEAPPDVRFMHDAGFFTDVRSSAGELFGDIPRQAYSDAREFISGVLS